MSDMNDPIADEIEELTRGGGLAEDEDGGEEEIEPPRRRPGRPRKKPAGEEASGDGRQVTMEELDAEGLIPRGLPKPMENVKTLGELVAKYDIGDSPTFKLQVHRTWPKIFPGGVKADGFYDTYQTPISEEMLQTEYGGGSYRIVVVGPHPSKPHILTKHYESVAVQVPGEPKYERRPLAMQGKEEAEAAAPLPQFPGAYQKEDPTVTKGAFSLAKDLVDKTSEDRKAAEQRADRALGDAQRNVQPLVDAYRERADELVKLEREKSEIERRTLDERLREERARIAYLEQKIENMGNNSVSIADEIHKLMPALRGEPDAIQKSNEKIIESLIDKHRIEVEASREQHAKFIQSVRDGHQEETRALREAHQRELAAEREAARAREARFEERLASEREERRRDQDRFRESMDARDQQWKDRLEQQKQMLENNADNRFSTMRTTLEQRIEWLQQEIDRKQQEMVEMQARIRENNDPMEQVKKVVEMKETMGSAFGLREASSSQDGGIKVSGGGGIWDQIGENLPSILETAKDMFQNRQQAPQYQPGQIVPTPQGLMVVVVDPATGQLALAPKQALDAAAAQGRPIVTGAPRRPGLLGGQGPAQPAPKKKRAVVQNLAEGLSRPKAPWEDEEDEAAQRPAAPAQPAAQRPAAPAQQRPRPQAQPSGQVEMTAQERQAVDILSRLVHQALEDGDEPEQFVQKLVGKFPKEILAQVADRSTDDIIEAIKAVQPQSAGTTPAGKKFVRETVRTLRAVLGIE